MTSSRYLTLTRYLTLSSALGRNRVTEVGSLSANANLATKFISGVYLLFMEQICRFSRNCKSKHLKGQLDPPVGNGNVFCIKGGQLDPPVGNCNIFCTKEGQLDPPVGNGNVFAPMEVSWVPVFVT